MNTKSRFAVITLVLAVLFTMIAPTAFAGEEFNLLTGNNEFDTKNEHGFSFLDPWWTLTNKTGDKIVCADEAITAFSGDCAFRFKGSANEASVLVQNVKGADLDTINAFVGDAPVSLRLDYLVNSLKPAGNLKGKAIVHTSAGIFKSIANFSGSTMIGEFTSWQGVDGTTAIIPQNAVISKVKVKISNKSLGGKTYIDNVNVMFASQGS